MEDMTVPEMERRYYYPTTYDKIRPGDTVFFTKKHRFRIFRISHVADDIDMIHLHGRRLHDGEERVLTSFSKRVIMQEVPPIFARVGERYMHLDPFLDDEDT